MDGVPGNLNLPDKSLTARQVDRARRGAASLRSMVLLQFLLCYGGWLPSPGRWLRTWPQDTKQEDLCCLLGHKVGGKAVLLGFGALALRVASVNHLTTISNKLGEMSPQA